MDVWEINFYKLFFPYFHAKSFIFPKYRSMEVILYAYLVKLTLLFVSSPCPIFCLFMAGFLANQAV